MQAQLRVGPHGVSHQPWIGQDDRIHAQCHGLIHGLAPGFGIGRLGVGVERHEHLAPTRMGIRDATADGRFVEVQARKVAGVGRVAQAQIDAVRAVVDRCLEGGQTSGGTDQIEQGRFGRRGMQGHGTELIEADPTAQ